MADLGQQGLRIANRAVGTGTRLLLDKELQKAGLEGERIEGYQNEFPRHLDVGLEVLSGRADAGPAIRPVAQMLGLDFIPLRWERFDLLISRPRFFEPGIQLFLGLLHEKAFRDLVDGQDGYDLSLSGKMVFP
jgi:molybdate-binding protein